MFSRDTMAISSSVSSTFFLDIVGALTFASFPRNGPFFTPELYTVLIVREVRRGRAEPMSDCKKNLVMRAQIESNHGFDIFYVAELDRKDLVPRAQIESNHSFYSLVLSIEHEEELSNENPNRDDTQLLHERL